jgi:hypothetical protein
MRSKLERFLIVAVAEGIIDMTVYWDRSVSGSMGG